MVDAYTIQRAVEADLKINALRVTSAMIFPSNGNPIARLSPLYKDCLVTPLSTINVRKTLIAKLCRREHDATFHASLVAVTRRVEPLVYIATGLLIGAGLSLFFVANLLVRTLASLLVVVCGVVFCVQVASSLLWDVLCLVVPTFDFWFLIGMNTVSTVFWCLLFHDIRAAALLMIGLVISLTMALDANIYTRRFCVRIYVLGPIAIATGLVFVFAQLPPDLHYTTYYIHGVAIDLVDLMINAELTVIYFMMVRGLRSWRLVISRDPVESVRCDVFLPVCRLAPQQPRSTASTQSCPDVRMASMTSAIRQMRIKQQADGQAIDVNKSLLPPLAELASRFLPVGTLNTFAMTGYLSSMAAIVWKVATAASAGDPQGDTSTALSTIAFVATTLFVVVHAAHFQPKLAKRVLREMDAWYMSFQISTTTLSMCDIVDWQPQGVVLFLTPFLWCHWTIFLDALPAITRRRLGCTRRLIVVVTMLLVVYPVLLSYYVYYSPARPFLRNRVLLEIGFGATVMRMETFGFLASKLFMLCVWALRSLWRELSRPADAFKLIELNAYYNVNGI